MSGEIFKGDPIPLKKLSAFEKAVFGTVNSLAYSIGYFVGILRYRMFKNMSVFDTLSAMSRGLEKAMPKVQPTDGSSGE